jgi:hypothetical protein
MRTVAQAIAKAPSSNVRRGGNAAAEISTGPVLQSAGKEEQDRQLGRIESQQPPRTVRLETLPQRKPGTHGDVEPCRERNHRETSPHRQLEVEPPIDHQHGRCLSDYGEPAQADKGVKAHAAPGLMR